MVMSRLVDKVREFLQDLGVSPGPLVVAVSGGPDSVALLRALATLPSTHPLTVAHLNHWLRGTQSNADEHFVRELCATLSAQGAAGLQFRSERLDVAGQARAERGNLEEVGRRLRYDWLTQVAREAGALFVATGHTANDQAETVLHRLLRGTGLKGLGGIAARRPLAPGIEVVRPLLHVSRVEVLAYLTELGQGYRQDSTNLNLDFTRNRIRHELLPYLEERYNPAIVGVLGRLAEQAREASQDYESLAKDRLGEVELPRAGNLLVFDQPRLAALPRHLVREVFRLLWAREGWAMAGMGFCELDRLAALVYGTEVAVDLPGGIRARRSGRVVQVGRVS
jgi:tRNA(Ile)-lysidine synthase